MEKRSVIVFRGAHVQPGAPEAAEAGCTCRFEANLAAGFTAAGRAERGEADEIAFIIADDCPLHEVIRLDGVDDDGAGQ
jgi:hypothetical protein